MDTSHSNIADPAAPPHTPLCVWTKGSRSAKSDLAMPSRNGESAKTSARARAFSEPRPLTKRELEVVEWIAAGKGNREIGAILGCSSRTVQKHVEHILEKLHLETRTAVCVWWYEHRFDGEKSVRPSRRKRRSV